MFKITAKEAAELFPHAAGENLLMAIQIRNAYVEQERNPSDADVFAYAACFNAGIIEGVRRERAKQKKTRENCSSQRATS